MLAQLMDFRRKSLSSAHRRNSALMFVLALFIAGVFGLPLAYARLAGNTIDVVATLSDDGQTVTLTGPLKCTKNQWVEMRVTVTQRDTGAVAEANALIWGTTTEQQWAIEAQVQGDETFDEGEATAVALAASLKNNGAVDDAHQWLMNITLADDSARPRAAIPRLATVEGGSPDRHGGWSRAANGFNARVRQPCSTRSGAQPAGADGLARQAWVGAGNRRGDQAHEHRLREQRATGQLRMELSGNEIRMRVSGQFNHLHDRVLGVAA
jgi:hypothetical protein